MMEKAFTSETSVNFYSSRLYGATTNKAAIYAITSMRISNPQKIPACILKNAIWLVS
jgi:hypothetical protein